MTDEEKLAAEAKAAEEAAAKAAAEAAGDEKQASEGLSQERIEAIIKRRVASAQKQWESDAAEKVKQATLSETERLQAEVEAAKKAGADTLTTAQQRIIKTEAKVHLLAEGANPERLEFLLRATDLADVEFDGEDPDLVTLQAAVAAVKKAIPEAFVAIGGTQRSGGDFGQGKEGKRIYTEAEIKAMTTEEYAKVEDDIMAASREPGHPRLKSS